MNHSGQIELCDGIQASCFENKMSSSSCDCIDNCKEMIYQVQTSAYPLNAMDECASINGKFKLNCRLPKNSSILLQDDINTQIAEKLR